MRTDGALNYLLGDHLGSTSLVTDAGGQNPIETRYTAWGEIRYSSGPTPTDYTYTGQFSYTADFGLMFYNARWYDSSLGRFAQADTIVPGGVQGLDRYAYVNNSPVRYTDPSGHKCVPVEECEGYKPGSSNNTSNDIPLTEASNSDKTNGGKNMRDLYSFMREKKGYNVYEFLAWVLAIESSGEADLFDILIDIASRRLWGDHINAVGVIDVVAACPTSTCFNGLFNYLGEYSSSAWGRYENYRDGDYDALFQNPTNFTGNETAQLVSSGGLKLATKNRVTYDNNTPMHFGFWSPVKADSGPGAWWVPNMKDYFRRQGDDYDRIGNGKFQIVYMSNNPYNGTTTVVFTINQAATWGGAP